MRSVAAASFLLRGYEGQAPLAGTERQQLLREVGSWTAQAVAATGRSGQDGGTVEGRGASWCQARGAQLRGDLDVALSHAQVTVALAGSIGELEVLARARALLAEVLIDLDRLAEAEKVLLEATGATERLGSVTDVMVWHMLATCRERRGDLAGALAAMRRYVAALMASRDVQVNSAAAVDAARLRREEVERERDSWRATSEQERRAARVDPLTGMQNRRSFTDAVLEHARCGTRLVLALVNLDHFKSVNDRYGHVVGDEVLVRVGAAMTAALADGSVAGSGLYRVGGRSSSSSSPSGRGRTPRSPPSWSRYGARRRTSASTTSTFRRARCASRRPRVSRSAPRWTPPHPPRTCCARPTGCCTAPRTQVATGCSAPEAGALARADPAPQPA